MTTRFTHLFLLMGAALIAGCATAPCVSEACSDDAALVQEVQGLLAQHADLGPPSTISVQAHAGVVYLHGIVPSDLMRQDAESVVRQSPHVKGVMNMIGVDNNSY